MPTPSVNVSPLLNSVAELFASPDNGFFFELLTAEFGLEPWRPYETLLTESDLARRAEMSPHTFRKRRTQGDTPLFHALSPRMVRYRERDFEAWKSGASPRGCERLLAGPTHPAKELCDRVWQLGVEDRQVLFESLAKDFGFEPWTDGDNLVSETEIARLTGTTEAPWRKRRRPNSACDGPPYEKLLTRLVRYRLRPFRFWVAAHRQRSTSDTQEAR